MTNSFQMYLSREKRVRQNLNLRQAQLREDTPKSENDNKKEKIRTAIRTQLFNALTKYTEEKGVKTFGIGTELSDFLIEIYETLEGENNGDPLQATKAIMANAKTMIEDAVPSIAQDIFHIFSDIVENILEETEKDENNS